MSDKQDGQGDTLIRDSSKSRAKKPARYKVLILNDDYTSMEFVIYILTGIFRHSQTSATRVMLHIHKQGVGVAGIYSKEIAETRVAQVLSIARESGHPLQCTMEQE
jgi:ATP-dependent Clp protease adaptor protein ClpS